MSGVGSTEPPRSAGAGFAGAGAGKFALTLRHELVGLGGIVERNIYLTKRYLLWDIAFLVWTIANTLTIVFIAQGLLLVVSGVYYPVSVLPHWMQWIATISPATYALRGDRASVLHGAGTAWADVWPLLVIGAAAIPLGLLIFRLGERYAKKHGKLKRSG